MKRGEYLFNFIYAYLKKKLYSLANYYKRVAVF